MKNSNHPSIFGPTDEELSYIDYIENNTSETSRNGQEYAEHNYNAVVAMNPENADKTLINKVVGGTLSFNGVIGNGVPVQNVYAFDTQNSKYKLTQTASPTLTNGKEITTTNVIEGRYFLDDGKLVLFEHDMGLDLEQYADIIYMDQNNRVISTILGEPWVGNSSIINSESPFIDNGKQEN